MSPGAEAPGYYHNAPSGLRRTVSACRCFERKQICCVSPGGIHDSSPPLQWWV